MRPKNWTLVCTPDNPDTRKAIKCTSGDTAKKKARELYVHGATADFVVNDPNGDPYQRCRGVTSTSRLRWKWANWKRDKWTLTLNDPDKPRSWPCSDRQSAKIMARRLYDDGAAADFMITDGDGKPWKRCTGLTGGPIGRLYWQNA